MESQVHQNFHADCEAAVNRMVNMELYASYVYLSMSYYFDRDDVALRHVAKFLKEQSHEEREHAEKFLTYQNKRGGRVVLQDIQKPEQDEWGNSLEALQCALQLEKTINQALLDLISPTCLVFYIYIFFKVIPTGAPPKLFKLGTALFKAGPESSSPHTFWLKSDSFQQIFLYIVLEESLQM
uniref:Ferritin n=1 Tax=Gopherus agassizii TaxID=38772 RepID=A0A452GEU6_9SAUR